MNWYSILENCDKMVVVDQGLAKCKHWMGYGYCSEYSCPLLTKKFDPPV